MPACTTHARPVLGAYADLGYRGGDFPERATSRTSRSPPRGEGYLTSPSATIPNGIVGKKVTLEIQG